MKNLKLEVLLGLRFQPQQKEHMGAGFGLDLFYNSRPPPPRNSQRRARRRSGSPADLARWFPDICPPGGFRSLMCPQKPFVEASVRELPSEKRQISQQPFGVIGRPESSCKEPQPPPILV